MSAAAKSAINSLGLTRHHLNDLTTDHHSQQIEEE